MLDTAIIDNLASGLIGGGGAIFTSILLLRRSIAEMEGRLSRSETERKECQSKCERKVENWDKQFARLDHEIIQGINEIKIQIAKLEGNNDLAKELVQSLRKLGPKAKKEQT